MYDEEFKVGQKVTYRNLYTGEEEIGIIKSFNVEWFPFVVYHCNNNWDRYEDYTGVLTDPDDLMAGWTYEPPLR